MDESVCCWETIIGQELFKLTLTHLMADLASIAVDGARWLLPRIRGLQRLEKWVGIVGGGRWEVGGERWVVGGGWWEVVVDDVCGR